jgi:hypothetical protein
MRATAHYDWTAVLWLTLRLVAISHQPPSLLLTHKLNGQAKVKVTLRVTASQSVSLGVEPPSGLMTRYLLLFDSYGLDFVGRPLVREDGVCLLYMQQALASAIFLGSESLGTRDHILLSQTRDFPFRRLLRLAGSRCRYSTPPPHGSGQALSLSLMLRPTVSRPVSLGIKHPSGA